MFILAPSLQEGQPSPMHWGCALGQLFHIYFDIIYKLPQSTYLIHLEATKLTKIYQNYRNAKRTPEIIMVTLYVNKENFVEQCIKYFTVV